jgi:hypothetical protein
VLDRVVEMAKPALTVRGSQSEVAPLLFASPEYAAWKLKLPVELNVTGREFGTTLLVTLTREAIVPGIVQTPLLKTL